MTAPTIVDRPSPNRAPRAAGVPVDTVVLHYTGMASAAAALDRLCDPAAAVSAHYVVLEDGTVLRLVPETAVAWHAGVSAWRGRTGLNARSIGIEIVNAGHDGGLPAYPPAQIAAVIDLTRAAIRRWQVPAAGLVGHGDTAPMRRADPGERFPWSVLAAAGLGIWPAAAPSTPTPWPLRDLAAIGYALDAAPQPTSVTAVVLAFQRRFQPWRIDGRLDEPTRARLAQIADAYRRAGETGGACLP